MHFFSRGEDVIYADMSVIWPHVGSQFLRLFRCSEMLISDDPICPPTCCLISQPHHVGEMSQVCCGVA